MDDFREYHTYWIPQDHRTVIVQADEKTVVHIEGYSVAQVEKLLEKAISVTAIQTEKDK